MIVNYPENVGYTKDRQEYAAGKFTPEHSCENRHRHHSCAMHAGFGHANQERYSENKRKIEIGKLKRK